MGAILTPAIDAIRKIDEPAADAAHAALLGALAARAAVPRDADYGRYTGHPMDPRTPDDAPMTLDEQTDCVIEEIGRACRAAITNKGAAADLLRGAADMLHAIADEVGQ